MASSFYSLGMADKLTPELWAEVFHLLEASPRLPTTQSIKSVLAVALGVQGVSEHLEPTPSPGLLCVPRKRAAE